jgi:aryl-alcohol dehydrogenase-like predicted oxidoreductase
LQTRRLRRTNLHVGIVGFGGTWIAQLKEAEACAVVGRAFDLSITYFGTARWDGDSEAKLGAYGMRMKASECS